MPTPTTSPLPLRPRCARPRRAAAGREPARCAACPLSGRPGRGAPPPPHAVASPPMLDPAARAPAGWEASPAAAPPGAAPQPPPPAAPAGRRPAAAVVVRVDDAWYDLSAWRLAHPAGTQWIDMFNGRDATEVLYAFHSDRAHALLSRLPRLAAPPASAAGLPDVTPAQRAFRRLRARLHADGWWEREWGAEARQLACWAACVGVAVALARGGAAGPVWGPRLAFLPLGLSFTAAGWLAHDYIHGRGPFCSAMRHFGGWAAGFGATMWSEKHNRHHALTNEVGADEDLSGGPVLFLWAPDPSRDTPLRPLQGLYHQAAFALLHLVWRLDSAAVALRRRLGAEALPLLGHYLLFGLLFPLPTLLAAVLLGGWVMANVVTTSHQSEELVTEPEHDWVRLQFRTTRDCDVAGPLAWLWGGMQYQLEHHLFPTMPRSRYPALRPIVRAFAAEHGLPFKIEGPVEIVRRNIATYARVAAAPAQPGARAPRKGVTL